MASQGSKTEIVHARRWAAASVLLNSALAAGKGVAGSASGSVALMGDAVHSATDVVGSAAALLGLWSDRALLYRQELGLDPFNSAMGVVVQRMVFGESSGVTFSMNPMDSLRASLEAVYGLNQGLVEGSIEPDHS
jgi:hypothetical protein